MHGISKPITPSFKTGKILELRVDIHNKSIIFGNTHDIADWISIQNEPKDLIRSFLIITSNHNKYIGF